MQPSVTESPTPDDLQQISELHRNLPILSRDNASYDDSHPRELSLSERLSVIIDMAYYIHGFLNLSFFFFPPVTEITLLGDHTTVACAFMC